MQDKTYQMSEQWTRLWERKGGRRWGIPRILHKLSVIVESLEYVKKNFRWSYVKQYKGYNVSNGHWRIGQRFTNSVLKSVDKENRLKILPTKTVLKSHDNSVIETCGKVTIKYEIQGQAYYLHFYIVKQNLTPLLGSDACMKANLLKITIN